MAVADTVDMDAVVPGNWKQSVAVDWDKVAQEVDPERVDDLSGAVLEEYLVRAVLRTHKARQLADFAGLTEAIEWCGECGRAQWSDSLVLDGEMCYGCAVRLREPVCVSCGREDSDEVEVVMRESEMLCGRCEKRVR